MEGGSPTHGRQPRRLPRPSYTLACVCPQKRQKLLIGPRSLSPSTRSASICALRSSSNPQQVFGAHTSRLGQNSTSWHFQARVAPRCNQQWRRSERLSAPLTHLHGDTPCPSLFANARLESKPRSEERRVG